MNIEKLQKVLAALESANKDLLAGEFDGEIKMLTELIDAPVQEPVGWLSQARCFVHVHECTEAEAKLYGWKSVYTTPPNVATPLDDAPHLAAQRPVPQERKWVGLTPEEIKHMLELFVIPPQHIEMVVQAIEAKLKAKNSP